MALFFFCTNAHASEWAVDAKRLQFSYGYFVGIFGGTVYTYENCKNIFKDSKDDSTRLSVAFSNWKQRHSYADNLRDDFDKRIKQEFGVDYHTRLILGFKKPLEDAQADIRRSYKAYGELNPCRMFTRYLTEKKNDYINTQNEQFRDILNALEKK